MAVAVPAKKHRQTDILDWSHLVGDHNLSAPGLNDSLSAPLHFEQHQPLHYSHPFYSLNRISSTPIDPFANDVQSPL